LFYAVIESSDESDDGGSDVTQPINSGGQHIRRRRGNTFLKISVIRAGSA